MLQTTSRQPKCQILGLKQSSVGVWYLDNNGVDYFSSNPESLSEAFQHIFGPNWLIWDNRRGNVQGAYLRKGGFFPFFLLKNLKYLMLKMTQGVHTYGTKKTDRGGREFDGRADHTFHLFLLCIPIL